MARLSETIESLRILANAGHGLRNSLPHIGLTPRERQLRKLIQEGKSDKEIAVLLDLSPGTVSQYLRPLYRKLGVHSRGELAALGRPT